MTERAVSLLILPVRRMVRSPMYLYPEDGAEGGAAPLAAVLREVNLSFSQYNVLRVLRGAGDTGLPCGEISERMVRRDPDLTRLLDRLEARRLISRARGTADRRVVLASITDEGRQLLAELADSIRRHGVLQPVVVRRAPPDAAKP